MSSVSIMLPLPVAAGELWAQTQHPVSRYASLDEAVGLTAQTASEGTALPTARQRQQQQQQQQQQQHGLASQFASSGSAGATQPRSGHAPQRHRQHRQYSPQIQPWQQQQQQQLRLPTVAVRPAALLKLYLKLYLKLHPSSQQQQQQQQAPSLANVLEPGHNERQGAACDGKLSCPAAVH